MRSNITFLLLVAALLPGCAAVLEMQPTKTARNYDVGDKGLVLFTAVLSHPTKPGWTPGNDDAFVVVEPEASSKGKKKVLRFRVEKDGKRLSPKGNTLLVRLHLDPGQYVIRGIHTINSSFPVIASAFVPMHSRINVTPGTIVYAGRLTGVISRRESDEEFRTGPMFPLIDQGIAGYALTTIAVEISDGAAEDVPRFQATFRALKQANIATSLLPPFDREAANAYWRNGGSDQPKSEKPKEKKKRSSSKRST